jgi:hypothetical protein
MLNTRARHSRGMFKLQAAHTGGQSSRPWGNEAAIGGRSPALKGPAMQASLFAGPRQIGPR